MSKPVVDQLSEEQLVPKRCYRISGFDQEGNSFVVDRLFADISSANSYISAHSTPVFKLSLSVMYLTPKASSGSDVVSGGGK